MISRLARNGDRGILLIGADPRGDLPGTRTEVEHIGNALTKAGASAVEVLTGEEATREEVLKHLESGRFTMIHFSGHSAFDAKHPYQSHLELAMGTKLRLHELEHVNRMAAGRSREPIELVFLNSCQSGRVGVDETTGRNLSMCRVLRESGVSNVVGMLWNVTDEAGVQFASAFYGLLAAEEGMDIAEAMRRTRWRTALDRAWADGSWLAPVLYG